MENGLQDHSQGVIVRGLSSSTPNERQVEVIKEYRDVKSKIKKWQASLKIDKPTLDEINNISTALMNKINEF